jgi:endoglucanase
MAMAYRIYKPYYPAFADSCLAAAEYAWQWAKSNPNKAYTNPGNR